MPDLDIDEALLASPNDAKSLVQPNSRTPPAYSALTPQAIERVGDKISEAVPDEADGFEWREEAPSIYELADGMAALSIEPNGTGYLGMLPDAARHG